MFEQHLQFGATMALTTMFNQSKGDFGSVTTAVVVLLWGIVRGSQEAVLP